MTTSYDLESEISVTQVQEEKMFTKLTAAWTFQGLISNMLTFEWHDLFYLKI